MDGDGFDKLVPRTESIAIGGTNVVLVDRVGAEYLGLWNSTALAAELGGHKTSPLLEAAAKRFGIDIAKPKLAGDGASLFDKPHAPFLIGMANFEVGERPQAPAAVGGDVVDAASLPKELHARSTPAAPAIDGAIDDAWKDAPVLTFSTDWAGRAIPTSTKVRALWTPSGLYLLFELASYSPFTDETRPTNVERIDLYEENCVELFLVPDPANRDRYFEIEVGPFGHFFDIAVDRRAKPRANPGWSGKLTAGTSMTKFLSRVAPARSVARTLTV
jgi:hypothetical protein